MLPNEQLLHTLELIRLERQADLEQYRQKILLRSLQQRTKEGSTWYPVSLKRNYIGTGERSDRPMRKYAQDPDSDLGKVVRMKPDGSSR